MKRTMIRLLIIGILAGILTCSAVAGDKLIAITFDDGPSPYTQQLLDGLLERDAQVTFFTVGYCVDARPETVKRAWMEGHQIANHTWDHPFLTEVSGYEVYSQVYRTSARINQALGFDLDYILRPPYGDFNSYVLSSAGVPALFWSMNTSDYLTGSSYVVCQQILQEARDGAVCCIHDSHLSTVQGALQAIDILESQGYECVTVTEMFRRRGILMENGAIYYSAYPGSYGTDAPLPAPTAAVEHRDGSSVITISGDPRGEIYYTLDGTQPTPANSRRYTEPITVSGDCRLRALNVVDWNGFRSEETDKNVSVLHAAEQPALWISEGCLMMQTGTPGGEIRYTADAGDGAGSEAVYAGPISLAPDTTWRARTYGPQYLPSEEGLLTWTKNGNVFLDVAVGDWFYSLMDEAVSQGILNGTAPCVMSPDEPLTRAMLVTMLHRLSRAQPAETSGTELLPDTAVPESGPEKDESITPEIGPEDNPVEFSDTDPAAYYTDALVWAVGAGIVTGFEDGTFRPDALVSREEMFAMAMRYLRYLGAAQGDPAHDLSDFTDSGEISEWARPVIAELRSLGALLSGYPDGSLHPLNPATRAEAAAFLLRVRDWAHSPADPVEVTP